VVVQVLAAEHLPVMSPVVGHWPLFSQVAPAVVQRAHTSVTPTSQYPDAHPALSVQAAAVVAQVIAGVGTASSDVQARAHEQELATLSAVVQSTALTLAARARAATNAVVFYKLLINLFYKYYNCRVHYLSINYQ
jgi:hypothetical protein